MEPFIIRIGSSCILLIRRHETYMLFQLVLDIPVSFVPAGLMSEATQVTTILGAVARFYNILL